MGLVGLLLLHTATASDVTVKTSLGNVVGESTTLGDGGAADIFRGLPFARPPIGARRWAPPDTALAPWSAPRPAKTFAPAESRAAVEPTRNPLQSDVFEGGACNYETGFVPIQ